MIPDKLFSWDVGQFITLSSLSVLIAESTHHLRILFGLVSETNVVRKNSFGQTGNNMQLELDMQKQSDAVLQVAPILVIEEESSFGNRKC